MKKFQLHDVLEIYITNECNLTCSNCNRYNNYNFSGHFDWREQQHALQTWGDRLSARLVTIIGGEPFLQPELLSWVNLIKSAWPDTPINIQTNGTVKHPDIDAILNTDNLGISVAAHQSGLIKKIKKTNSKFVLGPGGNIKPNVSLETDFSECAVIDKHSHFEVHDNNNVVEPFEACTMKYSHTILQGRLYKCPMVAILPTFQKQFDVRLTQKQQELLDSYRSLSHDCDDTDLEEFLISEHSPIPQCKLCPGSYVTTKITFDPSRKTRQKINITKSN
jgi:organic radical activating enzyme